MTANVTNNLVVLLRYHPRFLAIIPVAGGGDARRPYPRRSYPRDPRMRPRRRPLAASRFCGPLARRGRWLLPRPARRRFDRRHTGRRYSLSSGFGFSFSFFGSAYWASLITPTPYPLMVRVSTRIERFLHLFLAFGSR